MTRRERLRPLAGVWSRAVEFVALSVWTAIPSVYAVVARLWTPTPTRREETRRGN